MNVSMTAIAEDEGRECAFRRRPSLTRRSSATAELAGLENSAPKVRRIRMPTGLCAVKTIHFTLTGN